MGKNVKLLLKILIAMVVLGAGTYVFLNKSTDLNIDAEFLVGGKNVKRDINSYSVETKKANDVYFVYFKDLMGYSDDNSFLFNMSLTVETTSESIMNQLYYNRRDVVELLRKTLRSTSKDYIETAQGRDRLKFSIQQLLEDKYKTDKIDGVYIEKLVYQIK